MEAAHYDLTKLRHDMALRGWLPRDLARAAGVSDMTVSRFLSGERANPRTAAKLAQAIGYPVRRYLLAQAKAS